MKIKNALLGVATAASISIAGALPAMAQTAETTEQVTAQHDASTGSASGTEGQTPNQNQAGSANSDSTGSSNSGASEGTTGETSDGSSTQGSADFFGWTGNESGLDRFADVAKLIGSIAGIIGAIVGVIALL